MRDAVTDELVSWHLEHGFHYVDSAPKNAGIRAGARVHNAGQRYWQASHEGTATVVAVLRKGTDDRPDSWERSYGRPNVEVVVQRDDGSVNAWADYGTCVAETQPSAISDSLIVPGS